MATVLDRIEQWRNQKMLDLVSAGAEKVPEEWAMERIKVCQGGCEYYGTVEPLPKMKMPGCTECGCPSATKPHLRTIKRAKNKARS